MSSRRDSTAAEREKAFALLRSRQLAKRQLGVALLCEMFEPLIKTQAKAYRQSVSGGDLEDLEQEARVGLLEACVTFKPKRGAFPTHAVWCVRNALSKYVESLGNPVRLPAWMIRRLPKLRRLVMTLPQELGRRPTWAELSERMKMPESAIYTMMLYDRGPTKLPHWVSGDSVILDDYYGGQLAGEGQ